MILINIKSVKIIRLAYFWLKDFNQSFKTVDKLRKKQNKKHFWTFIFHLFK